MTMAIEFAKNLITVLQLSYNDFSLIEIIVIKFN